MTNCKLCNNSESRKKAFSVFVIAALVVLILKVTYELKYLDLISGILKVETNKKATIHKVSMKGLFFIGLVGSDEVYTETMNKMGWNFVSVYGRGMVFEKDGYEILISKRTYFNRYVTYEVTTREIFDLI